MRHLAWPIFSNRTNLLFRLNAELANEINERSQPRGDVSPAWVIKANSRKMMGPIFQHTHEPAMSKVRSDTGFSQVSEPDTSARGIQNKSWLIESKRSLDLD